MQLGETTELARLQPRALNRTTDKDRAGDVKPELRRVGAHAGRRESAELEGHTRGFNRHFDQIAPVEALPDRLMIHQGWLLHSGIISQGLAFSADPRAGRLTANFFVKAKRG